MIKRKKETWTEKITRISRRRIQAEHLAVAMGKVHDEELELYWLKQATRLHKRMLKLYVQSRGL